MAGGWRPSGYNSVSPYLITRDAEAFLDFVGRALGATPLRRHDRPDGTIMHAEVRIGDTVVMIGQPVGDGTLVPCHLHVYVPDVDRAYERALEAGGDPVQAPEQKGGDSDRRGGFQDPDGNTWWLATELQQGGASVDESEARGADGIRYTTDIDEIDWNRLEVVLAEDGFDNGRTPEQLEMSSRNSAITVVAHRGERPIGTARVLSDGVCNAYVVDVWTHSDFRGQGIARTMLGILEEQLAGQHIALFTDDARELFSKLGYADQQGGMSRVKGNWLQNDGRRRSSPHQ